MKNKILYSPLAMADLDGIWDYIKIELCNLKAADNVVGKIVNKIDLLKEFPEIGTSLSAIVSFENDYRFTVSGYHLIFYRFENNIIYVDRILNGKQNYMTILFGGLEEE